MRKRNPAPKQAIALSGLIEKENLKRGAEIGVFWGETTFYLADKFPNLELYGVDLWKQVDWGNKDDEGFRTYEQFPLNEYYEYVINEAKKYPNVHILKQDSVEAASNFENGFFDFIFIDGDHTYEGVRRDIEAWTPKVSKIVCGHDIHMAGVKKAVLENFSSYKELDNFVWYTEI